MAPALPGDWPVASSRFLAEGIGGRVWQVVLDDGERAVLKEPSPAAAAEIEDAIAYLGWSDGGGCVRLMERRGDLMLLEWAGSETLAGHLAGHGDDAATIIAADVVRRLHAPRDHSAPPDMMRLEDHFRSLFDRATVDRRDGRRTQFVEAVEVAERLLAAQRQVLPLHGDLHHDNVLRSSRGWIAIDPKGVVGDPVFDLANLFYNPLGSPLRHDAARAASMAAILSGELGHPVEAILDHAFAFSALSASWHVEDGNEEEARLSLAVGRAVLEARRQVTS